MSGHIDVVGIPSWLRHHSPDYIAFWLLGQCWYVSEDAVLRGVSN